MGKAKIVQFKDGTYGVRSFSLFGYKYLDFVSPWFWWNKHSRFFCDCCGTLDKAAALYASLYDMGTPIGEAP